MLYKEEELWDEGYVMPVMYIACGCDKILLKSLPMQLNHRILLSSSPPVQTVIVN